MRSTYGTLKDSTLDDWPIGYEDLEPYYEKAEYEFGVAGDYADNPFAPPRKKPLPYARLPLQQRGAADRGRDQRMGLHPFPIPCSATRFPTTAGRRACTCAPASGFACPVNAKNGTQNTVIPVALATGNCELRTGSVAAESSSTTTAGRRGCATSTATDGRGADRRPGRGLGLGHGDRPAAAQFQVQALSRRRRQQQRLGRAQPSGARLLRACGLLREEIYEEAGPGATRRLLRLQPRQPGAGRAAGCWPTSSSRCPMSSATSVRRGNPAGARHTRISSASTTSASCASWAGSGDAGLRSARVTSTRP